MKVIIAGGRKYEFTPNDVEWLDDLHRHHEFTEVVSGGAKGADLCGESWAEGAGLPVKVFPADWNKHGRSAGPIRNKQMADYLVEAGDGMVILFPGGKGTANMQKVAMDAGIPVHVRKAYG